MLPLSDNREAIAVDHDPQNEEIVYHSIGGVSPAIAWGTYRGATFDFRARWNTWDFVMTSSSEYPARDIASLCWYDLELTQKSEQPFPDAMVRAFREAFVRTGDYGAPESYAASYMPKDEIMRLVRAMVAEYEAQQGNANDCN